MGWQGDHAHRLTFEERLDIQRRVRDGERFVDAASAVGCSTKSVQRLMAKTGGLPSRLRPRSKLRLSLAEREEISRGVLEGESLNDIAARLQRAPSTISREVAANGGRSAYRAWRADEAAHRRARACVKSETDALSTAGARKAGGRGAE